MAKQRGDWKSWLLAISVAGAWLTMVALFGMPALAVTMLAIIGFGPPIAAYWLATREPRRPR